MEIGGKWSILVIYSGFSVDTEHLLLEAAGRDPINQSYDPHEGRRWIEFQYKTEAAARAARRRMQSAKREIEPAWKRPWVSPVRCDDYIGG
jgi:hypothetical protein